MCSLTQEIEKRRFLAFNVKSRHSKGWCLTQGDVEELLEEQKKETEEKILTDWKGQNEFIDWLEGKELKRLKGVGYPA